MDSIENQIKELIEDNLEYEFEELGESKLLKIKKIDESSIEFKSGLREGDKIIKINDLSMEFLTINQVDDIFKKCNYDDDLQLIILRNGNRLNVIIKKIIPKSFSPSSHDERSDDEGSFSLKKKMQEYNTINIIDEYTCYKRHCHWIAAKYYEKLNKYFVIPSIVITSLSGMLSFIGSSNYITPENGVYFAVSVGCLASMSSLIQSFSNAYGFSSKAEAHENAAESFDQVITKVRFSKFTTDKIDDKFLDDIKENIVEIKKRCKYIIPDWVDEVYSRTEYERKSMRLMYETKMRELKGQNRMKIKKMKFYEEVFDKLWEEKINKPNPTEQDIRDLDSIIISV